jgi:hypothetical protein
MVAAGVATASSVTFAALRSDVSGEALLTSRSIEVDRSGSREAPDTERFGVVTAYCRISRNANSENKCPEWVNDSL